MTLLLECYIKTFINLISLTSILRLFAFLSWLRLSTVIKRKSYDEDDVNTFSDEIGVSLWQAELTFIHNY